jgi:hypothetical protein
MVKRIAPVGAVSFVLLAACGAVGQNVRQSLPDAPSVPAVTQPQRFNVFSEEARSPLKFDTMTGYTAVMRQDAFAATDKVASSQERSRTIFEKYLRPLPKQPPGDNSSTQSSLMSRATYAASRTVINRDNSGKLRLNTFYLLRTLTSVAKDAASTPYWRRSRGEPFSDFGSTVGDDTGMNLWHEFGPGIQQLMKSHTPKFVSRIEEHVGRK